MIKISDNSKYTVLILLVMTLFMIPYLGETNSIEYPIDVGITVFKGNRTYAFLTSWDDGTSGDMIISHLMDDIDAKQTSFVITNRMDDKQLWGLDLLFRGHDIQSHSSVHMNHHYLNANETVILLNESVNDIIRLFGYEPIVLAYPYGGVNFSNTHIVLDYFDVARGIGEENMSQHGTWPIPNPDYALHSAMGEDGINDMTVDLVAISFDNVLKNGPYRAYKAYGHTKQLDTRSKSEYIHQLDKINRTGDIWFTSWGEAVSYSIQRENTVITPIVSNQDTIMFRPDLTIDHNRYCVENTFTVSIPSDWSNITVLDDGVNIPFTRVNNRVNNTLMFDMIPHNQTVSILRNYAFEPTQPRVDNIRFIQTSEGIAVLADIISNSKITGVTCTVSSGGELITREMGTPVFWGNNTYRSVFFSFSIESIDSVNITVGY